MKTLPLHLGCCPPPRRCALCSERAVVESLDVCRALLELHDGPVHTFGGPPPSPALVRAIGDRPLRIRVRPDLLDQKRARALVDAGVSRIELDALSLNDRVLGWSRRPYRGALVSEMATTLRSWGVEVGLVQGIGLPGGSAELSIQDAHAMAPLCDTIRLHPVLVIAGSDLEQRAEEHLYRPLDVDQAVDRCLSVLPVYESHDVTVLRVGMQAGPDGLGPVVGGPVHPSLRELVESQRTLERLHAAMGTLPRGSSVVVHCAPEDLSRTKGPANRNVRVLREQYGLSSIEVCADPALERGHNRVRRA